MRKNLPDIFKPPIFKDNAEKNRRAIFLHYASILLFAGNLFLFWVNLMFGTPAAQSASWQLGILAILQILIQWMIRRGDVDQASFLLVTIGWVFLTKINRDVGGIYDEAVFGYVLILLVSGYLLGWKIAFSYAIASIAALWWLAYQETNNLITSVVDVPYARARDLSIVFIEIIFVVYFLIKTLTNALDNAKREIAERIRIEAEREVLIKELNAKNAELESYSYAVAHDLKSPLFTIKGFLGYLKDDVTKGDKSRIQKDLQRMESAMDTMQGRLENLLDLSRAGQLPNNTKVIVFNDLVNEALELVQLTCP